MGVGFSGGLAILGCSMLLDTFSMGVGGSMLDLLASLLVLGDRAWSGLSRVWVGFKSSPVGTEWTTMPILSMGVVSSMLDLVGRLLLLWEGGKAWSGLSRVGMGFSRDLPILGDSLLLDTFSMEVDCSMLDLVASLLLLGEGDILPILLGDSMPILSGDTIPGQTREGDGPVEPLEQPGDTMEPSGLSDPLALSVVWVVPGVLKGISGWSLQATTGSSTNLATGHVLVWHCVMMLVSLGWCWSSWTPRTSTWRSSRGEASWSGLSWLGCWSSTWLAWPG